MSGTAAIDSASLDECVVLLAVARAASEGQTPANQAQLRAICNDHLEETDAAVVGKLTEADVSRALYSLEEAGLVVDEGPADSSPTGKGRPIYAPVPDPETLFDELAGVDDVAPLLEATDRP